MWCSRLRLLACNGQTRALRHSLTPWKSTVRPRTAANKAFLPSPLSSALLTSTRAHGHAGERSKPLKIIFQLADGGIQEVTAYEGQTLLDVATEHQLPMEGACGGACACSTCHVYLKDEEAMDLFPEPSEEENDMLDLAFFPEPTSRLGCQCHLIASKHDGLEVTLPKATRNMYVDGAKVVPH